MKKQSKVNVSVSLASELAAFSTSILEGLVSSDAAKPHQDHASKRGAEVSAAFERRGLDTLASETPSVETVVSSAKVRAEKRNAKIAGLIQVSGVTLDQAVALGIQASDPVKASERAIASRDRKIERETLSIAAIARQAGQIATIGTLASAALAACHTAIPAKDRSEMRRAAKASKRVKEAVNA
jgi:hypothetical protein